MSNAPVTPDTPDDLVDKGRNLEDGPAGTKVKSTKQRKLTRAEQRAVDAKTRLASPWASAFAIVMAILWSIPTFGLFFSSFRPEREIKTTGWWTYFQNPGLTLENYDEVLFGSSTNFANLFVNTVVITLPAVIIPITLALLAAYAFAWIDFKGRSWLFVGVFAMQVIPIQIALIPLLTQYVSWGLAGSFWVVWLSHSIFALPLAIFLLHNFMMDIPRSLIEAARVDGAGHVKIFFQVLLPLLVPAIASFAIFQFLWVWNDLLVALTFAGGSPNVAPLTVRIAELSGSRGADWHLLSAGAFISMIVPVVVFLGLQRFFVRGLLAGGVKG
jgi:alpha-glucoside transport system permease protein